MCVYAHTWGKEVLHCLAAMSLPGEECSLSHNKDFSPLLPYGRECFMFLTVCVCVHACETIDAGVGKG